MKLPISIFTLALDAMRFLPRQLAIFEQLQRPWHWCIVSGVADSVLDTSWVSKMPPRLSRDGTDEWLNAVLDHPNITVLRRQLWPGKNAMVNAALSRIKESCVVLQCDADEFWTPKQLDEICGQFENTNADSMRFFCRYYLGENIIATGENCWSARAGEWHRAWRWNSNMVSLSHEPPKMQGIGQRCMTRDETRRRGLVFEHEAYKYREVVAWKMAYYKYPNLVSQWERLQANQHWPVKRLADYFPFVGEGVGADLLP